MVQEFSRNWWIVGLRGLFAILLGIAAFVSPGVTLEALIYVFGAYTIIDGIFTIIAAGFSVSKAGNRIWMLFEGVLSVIAGIIAFVFPGITALAMLYLIAAYAFITGILEIATAFQPGNPTAGSSWLMALSGVLSITFGLLLVILPGSGLLSLIWLIGFYAFLFGFMLLGLAYQLYRLHSGNNRTRSSFTA